MTIFEIKYKNLSFLFKNLEISILFCNFVDDFENNVVTFMKNTMICLKN